MVSLYSKYKIQSKHVQNTIQCKNNLFQSCAKFNRSEELKLFVCTQTGCYFFFCLLGGVIHPYNQKQQFVAITASTVSVVFQK